MNEKEKTEKTVLIMACTVLGIAFAYMFMVTFISIPTSGVEHAKTITGFLFGSVITLLVGYYWGSSKGSAAKSDAMEKQLNGTKPEKLEKPKLAGEIAKQSPYTLDDLMKGAKKP